jgi:hypothetical protein
MSDFLTERLDTMQKVVDALLEREVRKNRSYAASQLLSVLRDTNYNQFGYAGIEIDKFLKEFATEVSSERLLESGIARISQLERDLAAWITAYSMGFDLAETPMRRYLPGAVYLDNDSIDNIGDVVSALSELCAQFDLEIAAAEPPQKGSFFQRLAFRFRNAATDPEVQKRLHKLEHILELELHGKRQAAIDKDEAEAASKLIQSLEKTANAVLQIGSLLIVKITPKNEPSRIIVRTLTLQELVHLSRTPSLLKNPHEIVEWTLKQDEQLPVGDPNISLLSGPIQ